jgi:hypothetical protein
MDLSLFQWVVLGGLCVVVLMLRQQGKTIEAILNKSIDIDRHTAVDDDEGSIEARRARQR